MKTLKKNILFALLSNQIWYALEKAETMLERSTTWVCQEGKKARWVNLYQNPSQQLEQTAQINYFLKCFDVGVHCDCEGYTLFKGVTLCADISAQTTRVHSESLKGLETPPKGFWECRTPREQRDWCSTLSKSCHRAPVHFISQMWISKRDPGRSLLPPWPRQQWQPAQPPCWWLWSAGHCRILSFSPFGFCICQEKSIPWGLHPLHVISWHSTGFRGTRAPAENSWFICLDLIFGWAEEVGCFKKDFKLCYFPVEVGMWGHLCGQQTWSGEQRSGHWAGSLKIFLS